MKNLLLLALITLPLVGFSQLWNQVSNFTGEGRHHPITFSNDNYGFVMSGSNLNDAHKYDKSNDTWTQLQNVPFSSRNYSYGVNIGDKAYMGFGYDLNGQFPTDWWQYDMNNDSWLQLANFPGSGRLHPAMIVVNNKIFVGCGNNSSGNLGDWWEYDVLTNVWTQKSNIIGNNRHHPYYFGIGNYAYVGFGHGSLPGPGSNPSSSPYIYNDFYKYDPAIDTWTQLSNFPSEARVAGNQFSFNGKGYIISGDGDNHSPLSSGEFWQYTPSNDSWIQLPSHPGDALWAPGAFVIGCDVYFLLGLNSNNGTYPNAVYKYTLSEDCGCTDPTASNYDATATVDDGSCIVIPSTPSLSLQLFLDGYYENGSNPSIMRAARYANLVESGSANPGTSTDVDVITIELRSASNPNAVAYSVSPILQTNGSVQCTFPQGALGNSYYIVVKHRSSLPLWSENPVTISGSTALNFSNNITNAYTDGSLAPMKTLFSGLYGIRLGEMNGDGYLDGVDYSAFETDVYSSAYGGLYLLDGDFNGDTYVDASDFSVFDFNASLGSYEQRP